MTDTPKKRRKGLVDRTLDAANKASEVAKELVDKAQETAKETAQSVASVASDTLQFTADSAQAIVQLAGGGAKITAQIASETARAATHLAQEAALQMAQTYFSKTTLTIGLPESQLNKQLRQMAEGHEYIDYITVHCGNDRLSVALDGHYKRLIYTASLDFDVLECKVSEDEQYLLLRHVDTHFDMQMRQARALSNFALRQAARGAAYAVKRLPPPFDPIDFFLEQLPSVTGKGEDMWHVDLHKNLMIELLHNRSWIVDKLLTITDLALIPGLSLLIDSEEMLQRLVNQFEIRSMRVLPGRLEVQIGINT